MRILWRRRGSNYALEGRARQSIPASQSIGLAVLLSFALPVPAEASEAQGSVRPHCVKAERSAGPMPIVTFTDATIEAEPTNEEDRSALQVRIPAGGATVGGVVLTDRALSNGSIEVSLLSRLADDAPEGSRGFAGVVFRAAPDASAYEAIYLRPTNARSKEQIRRNHSTQYISYPDYPWHRLRKEFPGQYESYVDLELGVWTNLRIEITDYEALLFVNGSEEPVLVIRDLKLGGDRSGQVGFWIGSGTIAYFADLNVNGCP